MNLLQDETSPYLRQHKDNPVHWMPWSKETLEQARRENKPILLSIGYSACHWCHVMAHESFEDAETADLMNSHFINIKLDREERPDLDAVYQGALSLMGKQGGWPLTMFLTPEGAPFWGGTYFPPQPRFGMPSFREVLRGVAASYAQDKDKVAHNIKNLMTALEKINSSQPGAILHREALDKISGYFLSLIDPANGGIGNTPKFPNLPIINFLWSSYIRTGNEAYKAAVIHSLTQMCQGGIYDHIGGGFSRYSVDAEWLVPHFEKMLYDNAQFISLLAEVYRETQHPLFAERLSETVEWVRRDLSIRSFSHTAFAASLDADSEGIEGKYYVWTAEEVKKILGPDVEAFKIAYDVTSFGNWEGTNILNRLRNPDYGAPEEEMQLGEWRRKLMKVRDARIPPLLDNKILADNNGLMIAALAKAGFVLDCREWIEAAENAFRFIKTYMTDAEGRLYHSWCDSKAKHAGQLEDYTNMAEAALALYEITQDSGYQTQAAAWVSILDAEFLDTENGGYFMSSSRTTDVVVRPKSAHDNAVPSGNGTMVGVLARLHALTGNQLYADRARETAEAFSGEVAGHFFPFATLLNNSDLLLNPVSVVILAPPATKGDTVFQPAFRKFSLPSLVKTVLLSDKILPKSHPAFGKTLVEGRTTAYVCFGQQCLKPVTTADELEELLRQERTKRHHPVANDG
jgi:uncharacterized protein YyaL (SSP411 family)